MTAEIVEKGSGYAPSEAELLETLFLSTLEEQDGLCLDNQLERYQLAAILTQVLVSAVRDGTINPLFFSEDHTEGAKEST